MAGPLLVAAASALPQIIGGLQSLFERVIPDPVAREKAMAETLGMLLAADRGQQEINMVEAASPRLFVSGWRPWIGWTCGLSITYHFIVTPFLAWMLAIYYPGAPLPPALDMEFLGALVASMLGVAGFRTYEKKIGVASK